MKTSLTYPKNHLVCFGAAVLLLTSAAAAKAQILLVNVTDPNHIVITATGFASSQNGAAILADGVDLLNFFQEGGFTVGDSFPTYDTTSSGASSLTTGNSSSGPLYTQASGDNQSVSNVDLNLYQNDTGDTTMTFTNGVAAFSGTLTLNNLTNGVAPKAGDTGEVMVGFSLGTDASGTGTVTIGTWEAVYDLGARAVDVGAGPDGFCPDGGWPSRSRALQAPGLVAS